MNKIILHNCRFKAHIGVPEAERRKKQTISISLIAYFDTDKSAQTDDIQDTVDYSLVHQTMKGIITSQSFHLAETLAHTLIDTILERFPVTKATLTLKKYKPMKHLGVGWCGVEITKSSK